MTPTVPHSLARRLSAAACAAGYAIGIPALLVRAAGWPLPRRLPSWSALTAAFSGGWRPDDRFVIAALAVIAWVVWAQIAAVTVSELRTIRSGLPGRTVPWSAWCRPVALRLAATLTVLVPLAPRAAVADPLPTRTAIVRPFTSGGGAPAVHLLEPEPGVAATQLATVVHIVRPGETLWDVARTQLGDPRRWREVFELNRDRLQPDGRRLHDADLLRPGWRLELPAPPSAPPNLPTAGGTASMTPDSAALSMPLECPGPPDRWSEPSDGGQPVITPAEPAPPVSAPTTNTVPTTPSPDGPPPQDAIPPAGLRLGIPAVALIGFPSLTGGVLLGYLGALRRDRERRRRRHHRFPAPTASRQAAERQVRAVARPDAGQWVDLALRHLAASLAEDGAPPAPTIRAVLAGEGGVEVLVSPPWPVAPGRFLPQDDGQIWRLDPALDLDELVALTTGAPAYVAGVVTVGETARGAVLVDLADAGSLVVEADRERADAIVAAMAAELAAAPWSENCDICLVGGALDLEALERVRTLPADGAAGELARLVGKPGTNGLADGARGEIPAALTIAVIAAGALPPDDLAGLVAAARPHSRLAVIAAAPGGGVAGRFRLVGCEDDTAMLYPLGLTVTPARPCTTATQLVELVAATATDADVPVDDDGDGAAVAVEQAEVPEPHHADHRAAGANADADAEAKADAVAETDADADPHVDVDDDADADTAVGEDASNAAAMAATDPVVEVRLLGPVEITWQHKTPKPQVGEFVSYLAVHPRSVTSDEARLALWPTTADDERFNERAPATFWALTTKARGALGDDRDGNSLLLRTANTLRLSPAVGCDWLEFQRHVAHARRHPGEAAMSLKAALTLVRGRPFQGSAFAWVEVERLDGVMEAAISDAAADLAETALESGDLATARFAVAQGLRGVPHAESLVRFAMRIAAAAGDRAGIERAWRDAQRIATDLDPLGTPEPETAQLYETLRRKEAS
jgi:DNA-binding SARP family transcriptional activator